MSLDLLDDHRMLLGIVNTYKFDGIKILKIFVRDIHYILSGALECQDEKELNEYYKDLEKDLDMPGVKKQLEREYHLLRDVMIYGPRLQMRSRRRPV